MVDSGPKHRKRAREIKSVDAYNVIRDGSNPVSSLGVPMPGQCPPPGFSSNKVTDGWLCISSQRAFGTGLWQSLLDLYGRCFGARNAQRFGQRWCWQYEDNPWRSQREPLIQLRIQNGKIVAHFGAFPLPMRIDGSSEIVLCGADLMVDTGFGFVALQLMKRFVEEVPVIGSGLSLEARKLFANFGGGTVALSRDRWEYQIRRMTTLKRKLRRRFPAIANRTGVPMPINGLPQSMPALPLGLSNTTDPVAIRRIQRFESDYDVLWENACKEIRFSIDKSSTYLNWRYVDSPAAAPCRLGLYSAEDKLLGVIVGGIHQAWDQSGRAIGIDGEVLDLILSDAADTIAGDLVRAAVNELGGLGAEIVGASGLRTKYNSVLADLGFRQLPSDRYSFSALLGTAASTSDSLARRDDWYVSAGDGDVLYGTSIVMKVVAQRQEGIGSIRARVAELTSPAKLDGEAVVAPPGPCVRQRLRHLVESGSYWAGLASAFAWVKRLSGAKILTYHSVAASDEEDWIDPRNNTTPDIFRRQIEFLARDRHVVSLSELVRAIECSDDITGGTVVITFDDGYLNTLRVAAPVLAEFKLPMTLFLSTGYVGRNSATWIDRLYTIFRMRTQEQLCLGWDNFGPRNLRNAEERTKIYKSLIAMLVSVNALEREQILAEVENQLMPTSEPPRLLLNWDEVRRLVREFPNVEIGAHTVEHIDLSGCTREQANEEILGSMADIEREVGLRPAHFSYPYGRMSATAHDLPGELGLRSALVTEPVDRVTSASDRFALPRLQPPRSMSRFGFLTSAAYPDLSRLLTGQVRHG